MPYREIEIVGYLEDSPKPLFNGTEDCHVDLVLSAVPPKDWSEMLFGMVSGGASGDDPVGERMELSNRVLTVTILQFE